MQSESVFSVIESVADPCLAEEWDQSGVQVASTRKRIHRLAVTLDPTPSALQRALQWGADCILAHHPLTLQPTLPSRLDDYHHCLRLLLGSDVWLYSAHTSLDVRTRGPASWLAQSLGLEEVTPVVKSEHSGVGFGIMGNFPSPLPWSRVRSELARATGLSQWCQTGTAPQQVRVLAYCPGSGMSLASAAFQQGAQVFISGDLKYHAAQELEGLGLTLDVGHFILEERMMQAWTEELRSSLETQGVSVDFFPGHNPIAYAVNP